MIKLKIISVLAVFFAIGLIFVSEPAHAEDIMLPVTAQKQGLSLQYPLEFLNGNYVNDKVLSTVEFQTSTPLVITQKKDLPTVADIPAPPLESASPSAIMPVKLDTTLVLNSLKEKPVEDLVLPSPTEVTTPTPATLKKIIPAIRESANADDPTSTPSPTVKVTPTVVAPQTNTGGLNAEALFGMVNAHRQSKGMEPFQKDDRLCAIAAYRAPEINGEVASGTMHAGIKARNLPFWNTENIISMGSVEGAFNWWIHDTIHRDAIEGPYKYSCVACAGNACAEEFSNFQPK